jgi:hypothetical protein
VVVSLGKVTKGHWIVHLPWVNFMMFKIHLSEVLFWKSQYTFLWLQKEYKLILESIENNQYL